MLTMDEIRALSPEEQTALHRRLAKQAFTRFLVLQTIKWAIIMGVIRLLRKASENASES